MRICTCLRVSGTGDTVVDFAVGSAARPDVRGDVGRYDGLRVPNFAWYARVTRGVNDHMVVRFFFLISYS